MDDRVGVSTLSAKKNTIAWAVCYRCVHILNTQVGDLAYRTCIIKGFLCIYRLLDFGDVHAS